MQPNVKIDLFMVAPDDRREKVSYEINRPTFARAKSRLSRKSAGSFPARNRRRRSSRSGGRIRYMKPEFISEIAKELAGRITREGRCQTPAMTIFAFPKNGPLLSCIGCRLQGSYYDGATELIDVLRAKAKA